MAIKKAKTVSSKTVIDIVKKSLQNPTKKTGAVVNEKRQRKISPYKFHPHGKISLRDIRVYAHHGCTVEEQKIGSEYLVDVEIKADLSEAMKQDDLSKTVDYSMIHDVVIEEMGISSRLLERVAARIGSQIMNGSDLILEANITVRKLNPPVKGSVGESVVKLMVTRDYVDVAQNRYEGKYR